MEEDKQERVRQQAYKLWEDEGRPEGRHDDHWSRAERHVGMLGDGTEEQGLDQRGDPEARVTEPDVEAAFSQGAASGRRPPASPKGRA